jgi:hypothetical protein
MLYLWEFAVVDTREEHEVIIVAGVVDTGNSETAGDVD